MLKIVLFCRILNGFKNNPVISQTYIIKINTWSTIITYNSSSLGEVYPNPKCNSTLTSKTTA